MRDLAKWTFVAALGGTLAAAAAHAQPVPFGEPLEVATAPSGPLEQPDVAAHPDGGYVLTWEQLGEGIQDRQNVWMRRIDRDGASVGDAMQVNTYTTHAQSRSEIGVAADGRFVVVWQSDGSNEGDEWDGSIQLRSFDASGAALGPEEQVNEVTQANQWAPAVATEPGGGTLVVWASPIALVRGVPPYLTMVRGRWYSPAGVSPAGEFRVDDGATHVRAPAVAAAPDGSFLVAWTTGTEVRARVVDASGVPDGPSIVVAANTSPAVPDWVDVTLAPDGSFAAFVWSHLGYALQGAVATTLDDGVAFELTSPVLEDFDCASGPIFCRMELPVLAATADGDVAVGWHAYAEEYDRRGVFYVLRDQVEWQTLSPAGIGPLHVQTPVEFGHGDAKVPAIAIGAGGDGMVVWPGRRTETPDAAVLAQPIATPVFADGFEEGDASGWPYEV